MEKRELATRERGEGRERTKEEREKTMKERADVYRVRDNQRGATLIIVIGVLSLKRRVTRTRCAACALRRAPATRVTHAGGFKEADRGGSARAMYACIRARAMRASAPVSARV